MDRSHLSPARRARLNFDHPRAIDWQRLEKTISQFSRGRGASVPRYDFVTHGRIPGDSNIESRAPSHRRGPVALSPPHIAQTVDLKIFIRSTAELCKKRRLQRDTTERGRTRQQVLEQLSRYTLPMSERFVAPQEKWSDLTLDAPVSENQVFQIVNKIQANHKPLTVGI